KAVPVDPAFEAPGSSPPEIITIPSSSPANFVPPPVPPPRFKRKATPPTPTRPPSSKAPVPQSLKRSADDSGYVSHLESSVRPLKARRISASELDIEPPRIKRGRAEEEIA